MYKLNVVWDIQRILLEMGLTGLRPALDSKSLQIHYSSYKIHH